MKSITIFTPTYNRAYLLPQLYNSLVNQTNKDFIWLVIDDGSSDNTKKLVSNWKKKSEINIQYIYQENQGMHGAHNTAYKNIDTELNTCIDSDDYMPNDAVKKILVFWDKNKTKKYAGLVGLDMDKNNNIIGSKFPTQLKEATLTEIYHKYKVTGDKKLVYRTDVVNKYPPYPIFKGEKFVPLGYLYSLIDKNYTLLVLNEPLCIVEYLSDGSTMNIFKQYIKNPRGFIFSRIERMKNPYNFKDLVKNTLHYISSNFLIKNKRLITESPKKFLTFLLLPFGFILYLYTLKKANS